MVKSVLISLTILLLCCSSSLELNSEPEETRAATLDKDSKDTPLCRQVRRIKIDLLRVFPSYFKDADLQCDIRDDCKKTVCFLQDKENISGGYQLLLCESKPIIEFWVDSPSWTEKWSHNFTILNDIQKVEVVQQYKNSSIDVLKSRQRWYLKVWFNLSESKIRTSKFTHKFLNLSASFESWSRESEKLISQNVIINTTHFPLNQLCDPSPQNLQSRPETMDKRKYLKFSVPQSGEPSQLHYYNNNNVRGTSESSSLIGKPCDPTNIFSCGNGATCVVSTQPPTCECMVNFVLAKNGSCIPVDIPNPPTETPPVGPSTSYSPALGISLSIFLLIGIATAVYFGHRHRVIDRIRHRIPVTSFMSFWPFRTGTSSTVDDQIMVDPFTNDDDDAPLNF